jgi:rSAM/selenodomain-associated transferase 2
VDGGSTDGTPEVARAHDARVLASAPGRARQMNAGAEVASGEVLLFLHADTRLPEGAFAAIHDALADPGVSAGCFRLRFDTASFWLRVWTLPIWMRWKPWAFGDRALFVRRSAFNAVSGFPVWPLFEDVEMVQRVGEAGRFAFLPLSVTTSARRYDRNGRLRQQLKNLALWGRWWLGARPEGLEQHYRPDHEEAERS